MNKHKPDPPPSSLLSDPKESDKKTSRRRRPRRTSELAPDSDGASSSCQNGSREGRGRTGPADPARPFRSPSPSCTPNPSFRSKGYEIFGLEQCAVDSGLQGISSLTSGTPENGISRSGSGISIPSKSGSKESSPLPIPKAKGKESAQTSSSKSDSYSGKGLFSKPDKFRYSPKVKVDTPRDARSTQFCNCADDAVLGSGLFPEEGRAGNACSECRSSGEDGDSGASWQESKFYGSPTTRFSFPRPHTSRNDGGSIPRSYFPSHWPLPKVDRALEAGELFCARIRINAHNRNEAYVSLDGVPTDILIDGVRAQNRAIDGDVVAVRINPISAWPKLRGALDKQTSGDIAAALTDRLACNNDVASTEIPDCSSDEAQLDTIDYSEEATISGRSDLQACVETGVGISSNTQFKNSKAYMTSEIASNLKSLLNTGNQQSTHDLKEQIGLLQPVINEACASSKVKKALDDLIACVSLLFDKRPTGEVVAILEKSNRREAVIGFLELHQKFGNKCREEPSKKIFQNSASALMLLPSDSKFPKMVVAVNALPVDLKKRFHEGDVTLGSELMAAHVADWRPDSLAPDAIVIHSLGQGGEIEPQTAAILFEHAVHSAEFPSAALECLPKLPWKMSSQEWKKRRDLRQCRVFSIDPPTARDLDDALSIERLENGLVRVGVHIADVSYFVHPDSALDKEAQVRSTSVYLIQRVLPMLPPLLSEELCSLNPGVDRLTLSVIWDVNAIGQIVDHWIGRTIIRSCCKLSYNHSQEMIDGRFDGVNDSSCTIELLPELHGSFKWSEIIEDVKALHGIAKQRRDQRFEAGALRLDNAKLVFALDEDGIPTDSNLYEHQDSNFLVEEFMLLANMTVAKVISSAFPDCALLRRHPEPNLRKMKELEEFCNKNGFELNASSSGALHESLWKLRGGLKEDPVLCSILMLYATKPMQLAKYFSTGELRDKEEEWVHYALATPFYTHFTSPIRRYPDILVHRTLIAVLEAEEILCGSPERISAGVISVKTENTPSRKCFTGLCLDKQRAESPAGQKALAIAASKHKVLGSLELAMVAEHCNERKLASRNVKDASDKLYLWAMLKRRDGILSEARVLAVGPKFVSLYVHKIAMERRIYYEETEGLKLEWFQMTGTLVMDLVSQKGSLKKQRQGRSRAVADVAVVVNPADSCNMNSDSWTIEELMSEVQDDLNLEDDSVVESKLGKDSDKKLDPAVLPLTLRLLASVPVYVYAVGGETRPLDIAVRLFLSSYIS